MTKILTYGLMASTTALAAALPLAGGGQQAVPARPGLGRTPSRFEEDMQEAGLMRRDNNAAAGVDWKQATANVDWDSALSGIDWSKVDYTGTGNNPPAVAAQVNQNAEAAANQKVFAAPSIPEEAAAASAAPKEAAQAPAAPASQPPAASEPPAAPAASSSDYFAGIEASHNAVAIVWEGDYDATFNVYANTGPYQPGLSAAYKSVVVKARSNSLVTLPAAFSGRVQLMSGAEGKADDDSTWGEFAFDQWQGLTFFDISCIRGVNAGLSMAASDGSQTATIPANILQLAPESIKVKDSGGRSIIQNTEGYDGSLHQGSIDWLHSQFKISDAYVRNFEDESTKSTKDRHLVLKFTV